MGSRELALFEANLEKANKVLKFIGLQTDDEESNQNFTGRTLSKKFFWFFNIILYSELLGELAWFVEKGTVGSTFMEATYTLPCVTLCLLGSAKTYYRIKYGDLINDLIRVLRKLQSTDSESGIYKDPIAYESICKIVKKLGLAIKALTIFNTCGLVAFLLGPLAFMGFIYHTTGVMKLRFPFLILYPFNVLDLRVYPFVYVHQIIGGTFAVYTIFGPDCLYYLFCTFVQVQFCSLKYDLERIVPERSNLQLQADKDAYSKKCVNLIETIFCKSALFNFMSSSLLLCLAGFNIVAYEDVVILGNFLCFLVMCLLQIYLICYYGDNVSRASVEISNAVYNSQWYNLNAKSAKDLRMVLMRSQKPCKLTAYTYTEINLTTFTRILSTSWSYFALLQSVYNRK
ncbi:odorant receptor 4-like [Choristoneura fumiferana]|uniref:odorant receptor 4-like n=1 Tax=Choristoneura fumiferana TaxID=7141 RepID=UPI003D153EF9